jgi:inward rectifier potassium channel
MQERIISVRPEGADYEIRVIGGRARPLRDFYHFMMRLNWPWTLTAVTGSYLFANALFALLYLAVGGIANAASGSFTDAFFFSVETMGTIGYGYLYPSSLAANWLMVAESMVGLTLTALNTGLVFAKFSRPSARIVFSEQAVISPVNGVPTLMFRIGNERGNMIVDTQMRCVMSRTEQSEEGHTMYKLHDLKLVRARALTLNRALIVSHRIDADSVLFGQTPESLEAMEYELQVAILGIDDIAMQTVHALHRYYPRTIVWGARLCDILSESPDGATVLDLRKFHAIEPSRPSAAFPYPRQA